MVRATQKERDVLAKELVDRGIATVIPAEDVATVNGEKVLNGAFGVVKPNRFVNGQPVLRLIMDFRAANALHRSLPGSVSGWTSQVAGGMPGPRRSPYDQWRRPGELFLSVLHSV